MFFYLLYNSSLIKKKNDKEKLLYTLIYGSVVYIIFHALFSFSKTFKDLIKYLWFFFLIDCISLGITSDFKGFSSINYISTNKTQKNNIRKVHFSDDVESDEEEKKPKPILKKVNKKEKQKIKNRFKEELKQELKKEIIDENSLRKNKLENSLRKNKMENRMENRMENTSKNTLIKELPISDLNEDHIEYNDEEANDINLTLQNLEQLELEEDNKNVGSSNIKDLQRNFLKKKMDEESDPGSDIDLEMFEQSLME